MALLALASPTLVGAVAILATLVRGPLHISWGFPPDPRSRFARGIQPVLSATSSEARPGNTKPPGKRARLTQKAGQIISRVVYLVCLHPLAPYPGPVLAKVTPLYAAYHGWRGDIHLEMWRCHQRYGERELLFARPHLLRLA